MLATYRGVRYETAQKQEKTEPKALTYRGVIYRKANV